MSNDNNSAAKTIGGGHSNQNLNAVQGSLDFMARLAANRPEGKRQIKLRKAADILQDGGGAGEDSEEDADYDGGGRDTDHSSDSGDDDGDGNSDEDEGEDGQGDSDRESNESTSDSNESALGNLDVKRELEVETAGLPAAQRPILCSLCLNVRQVPASDEVVQCDKCGVAVHESCYGQFDVCQTQSQGHGAGASTTQTAALSPHAHSNTLAGDTHSDAGSSDSTEPWFCEQCVHSKVLGTRPVHCELCPSEEGVLKRTSTGGWVHLLCALYMNLPFDGWYELSAVSLHDMDYKKYGSKTCSLCVDKLLARTGVCLTCEAGMCKTFFHATCAFRKGLLCDGSTSSDEIDRLAIEHPYYALCQRHSRSDELKTRQKLLQVVERQRAQFQHEHRALTLREQRKLTKRVSSLKKRAVKAPNRQLPEPGEKWPRLLHTNASLLRRILYKAESTAAISKEQWQEHLFVANQAEYVPAAFAPEFVRYFQERHHKLLPDLEHKEQELKGMLDTAKAHEQMASAALDAARAKSPKKQKQHPKESGSHGNWTELHMDLVRLGLPEQVLNELGIDHSGNVSVSLATTKCAGAKVSANVARGSTSTSTSFPATNSLVQMSIEANKCDVCKLTTEQHRMIDCDTCKLYFHIGCLQPALARLPKKTSQFGWECSRCFVGSSDSSDQEEEEITKAELEKPRKLRERGAPTKKHSEAVDSLLRRTTKAKRRRPNTGSDAASSSKSPTKPSSTTPFKTVPSRTTHVPVLTKSPSRKSPLKHKSSTKTKPTPSAHEPSCTRSPAPKRAKLNESPVKLEVDTDKPAPDAPAIDNVGHDDDTPKTEAVNHVVNGHMPDTHSGGTAADNDGAALNTAVNAPNEQPHLVTEHDQAAQSVVAVGCTQSVSVSSTAHTTSTEHKHVLDDSIHSMDSAHSHADADGTGVEEGHSQLGLVLDVHTSKPKGQPRKQYASDSLQAALRSVFVQRKSVSAAADDHQVPRSTLNRHVVAIRNGTEQPRCLASNELHLLKVSPTKSIPSSLNSGPARPQVLKCDATPDKPCTSSHCNGQTHEGSPVHIIRVEDLDL